MSQQSIIFLIDLGEQGAELEKTLRQSGFDARAISMSLFAAQSGQIVPDVVVAPHLLAEDLASVLRASLMSGVTFFALAPESAGTHVKGSLPKEVTAVLRSDIDPGILSLRLKAATQQVPRRSPTLMGFVPSPPLGSSPAAAAAVSTAVAPTPGPASSPASVPPVVPSTPSALSQPPPSVAPVSAAAPMSAAPATTASATSVFPAASSSAAPGSKWPAASSPPLVPQTQMSAADTAAPPSTAAPQSSTAGFVTSASVAPGSGTTLASPAHSDLPAHSTSPARPASPDLDDVSLGSGRSSGTKLKLTAAAALLVGLGGGTALLLNQSKSSAPQAVPAAAPAPASSAIIPAAPAPTTPAADVLAKADSQLPDPKAEQPSDSATELYRIAQPVRVDDCDKVLEKPESYYKKQPQWKSDLAWKNARKFLVQGKDDRAFVQMCQSAVMDPGGQAIPGLVNYFLRLRAPEQAQAWAERGVADSKSNRVAKEALGDALSQLGKVDEARVLWLETAKLSADKQSRRAAVARNWLKSAKKASKSGDTALAERLLRRAAAFDDTNAETAAELAATLQKNEQPQLAKNWAQKALQLDPKSEQAQAVLSSLKL